MYVKQCEFCGIKFQSIRRKTCSNTCKGKLQYQKRKKYCQQWWKKYYLKHKKELNRKSRFWYHNNKTQALQINKKATLKYKNKTRFDGKRQEILEAHNNKCDFCEKIKKLHIHHIDGQSYWNSKKANNDIKNLMVLCSSCHKKLHWFLVRMKRKSDTLSNGR